MASIDLKALMGRLNPQCRIALEGAAGLALLRTHYNVEVEHWLAKLLEDGGADLSLIFSKTGVDLGRLRADLDRAIDRLRTGNGRSPGLSPELVDAVKQSWLVGSIDFSAGQVRSGHLLVALLSEERLDGGLRNLSPELKRLSVDALKTEFAALTAGSSEEKTAAAITAPQGSAEAGSSAPAAVLERFTSDLTAAARAGEIDPILGRDTEIRQIIDILIRRRQNNPILTGEAGVGKTAVVEGFALRVASGDVPPALRGVAVRSLDLTLLQAGASAKGEFESRLRSVVDAVKASPTPIILFIDEAHTLIGAGGAAGQGDAANLLKPALARGELRTIAATTWAEYKKYFEKDAALVRRFQVVKVEEPTEPVAVAMLRGLLPVLERYHKVRILEDALSESVRLSARYIPSRQLPDKAVSLLDTACARVSVSRTTVPAEIEDRNRRLAVIAAERAILDREAHLGGADEGRIAALEAETLAVTEQLTTLETQWTEEKALIEQIEQAAADLDSAPHGAESDLQRERFAALRDQLRTVQGERPLIRAVVDADVIADVVQNWTGIPAGRMRSDEIRTVLSLQETMERRVVGQSHAIRAVAQVIRTSRAGLTDPRKPLGVFLMVGPSGVGKTETALTLADLLYGGEQNLTTINMSEYKEEHKVSLLMGSPPGYVGYGEGGILTEAVRRKPYSVILLDEMEKAHPGVQDVFFQVFDKGQMKDGEGRDIDFKNTVIIMTSNAASDIISSLCADPETMPDVPGLVEAVRPELLKHYKAAFLGRVAVVPYLPLSDETIRKVIGLQMERIRRRVRDTFDAAFTYDEALVESIAARCTESGSGARNIETILSQTMLPALSGQVLERLALGQDIAAVHVGLAEDGTFSYSVS